MVIKMKKKKNKNAKLGQQATILRRFGILTGVIVLLFMVLLFRLYHMTYLNRQFYKDKLKEIADVKIEGNSAPRGRIYDRNYNLLVDNRGMKTIYYKKDKNITIKDELQLARDVSSHLQIITLYIILIN